MNTSRKTTITVELDEQEAKLLGRTLLKLRLLEPAVLASTVTKEEKLLVQKFEYMIANSSGDL